MGVLSSAASCDDVRMPRSRQFLTAGTLALVLLGLGGCAQPSEHDQIDADLVEAIEASQDYFWGFRHELADGAEAALATMDAAGDLRPLVDDSTYQQQPRQFQVIGVDQGESEATLTLLAVGSASVPGWRSDSTVDGYTCYTLWANHNMPLVTEAASCATPDGRNFVTLLNPTDEDPYITSVDELEVRREVDSLTYQQPCQCSSGGTCECPGG